MGKIKVGVQLHPQHVSYETYAEAVKATEAAGVDSIWNWIISFRCTVMATTIILKAGPC